MDLGLSGARAVITGGSRGIGRSTAERLLMEGAEVLFCSRSQDSIDETVARYSPLGPIAGVSIDVSDHDALAEWVTSVGADGGIDVVISNASALGGISRDNDGWRKSFEVDVLSATTLFDASLPFLLDSERASFIQLSTITAVEYHGYPGGGLSYGAVKAALVNWVKQLAIEYAKDGIRANAVGPGPIFIEDGSWGKIARRAPSTTSPTSTCTRRAAWAPPKRSPTSSPSLRARWRPGSPARTSSSTAPSLVESDRSGRQLGVGLQRLHEVDCPLRQRACCGDHRISFGHEQEPGGGRRCERSSITRPPGMGDLSTPTPDWKN